MAGEKTSKIGRLGGPLLGGAADIVGKAARRPTEASEQAARGLSERIRGRAAHRANRTGGFVTRIVFSLMGNQVLPTRHQTAARIERGNNWNTQENQQVERILRNRYNNSASVAEGKQAWVDSCRRGGRFAEQAVILLLNSQSWPEFQSSLIQCGRNRAKRVTEIAAWQDVLSIPENGQLWQLVADRRPDLTPDIQQGAEQALGITYESLSGNDRLLLDDLSRTGLLTAVDRLNVSNIARIHEGFFSEIGRLNDPFLSQTLFDHLQAIASLPGNVGREALGSFVTGPRQEAVDDALATVGQSYATI